MNYAISKERAALGIAHNSLIDSLLGSRFSIVVESPTGLVTDSPTRRGTPKKLLKRYFVSLSMTVQLALTLISVSLFNNKLMSLIIGITHCDEWANYERWLKSFDSTIKIIRLKAGESTKEQIRNCDGIILSGGEDVHPSLYNKPEYISQFNLSDFNQARDEFEFLVLKEVTENNIPLLGICRGLQFANVYFGGTLIPDLPSNDKTGHSSKDGKKDTVHSVELVKESALFTIIGEGKGNINSHHHQAADSIGKGLKAVAFSEDGVVEGIEKENTENDSFLTLVQWHPERMDVTNPFSGRLREAFMKACKRNRVKI
jgi:putative glutamine amidotransferase